MLPRSHLLKGAPSGSVLLYTKNTSRFISSSNSSRRWRLLLPNYLYVKGIFRMMFQTPTSMLHLPYAGYRAFCSNKIVTGLSNKVGAHLKKSEKLSIRLARRLGGTTHSASNWALVVLYAFVLSSSSRRRPASQRRPQLPRDLCSPFCRCT